MDTGNASWLLTSSALVLLMTPGLAFFYGGLVRKKNAAATIMHSLICIGIVGVIWVVWGYALAFGKDVGGIIGWSGFGLSGISPDIGADSDDFTKSQLFAVFQGMFAIITPALITGAFAARIKFSALVIFTILWVTLVYSPLAHWVWGGGWLSDRGGLDFAGGLVVHISSGVSALAAAWIVFGRRLRFQKEPMEPHNVPFVVLGAGLLWFGWFGFNAGSALAANGTAINAFVVTNTAAATAMVTWVGMSWVFSKKPSIIGAASGAVAGLVAITPAAGFVGVLPAIVIGIGAGIFCYLAIELLQKLRIDDALAVFGVHGVGGTWGAIATGLFVGVGYGALADGMSRGEQILEQIIGVLVTYVFSFVMTLIIFLAIKYTIGVKISDEAEEVGLDISEHGEPAYRDI